MEILGSVFLNLALVGAFFSASMAVAGAISRRPGLVTLARNAVWVVSLLIAAAAGTLVTALLTGQYHIEYVYAYSNSTMPFFYKVAALWGGQAGSLLFWVLILGGYSSIVMVQNRRRNEEFLPTIIATLMMIASFFLVLLVFAANPFDVMPFSPPDGRGLNPLLQNYYMVIHPPSLYFGYVGMSVPFSFAIAALITGRLDNHWILQIRRWTLTAWLFLSVGNLLGASWAYEVLGWGGYWAWDPVENAAFIPWLTCTAFLHSVIVQEKRGILKTWNMALVILSFLMTMIGTFITRSGLISSVHSFAQSNIGTYFLVFLAICIAVSGGLMVWRADRLRSRSALDSFVSREATFLFNNLILVGAAFAVLWGTLFPVLSEWVRGTKITVGAPFFNSVMIPIGLILLFLTGIGPMVAWRKSTPEQLKKNFLWPAGATLVAAVTTVAFTRNVGVVICLSFCAFVLSTIVLEYVRGIGMRRRTLGEEPVTATLRLVASNRRRYGGYIVHFGVVLLFVGFAGGAFDDEQEFQLKPGQGATFGRYELRYDGLQGTQTPHKEVVTAGITAFVNGRPYAELSPARVYYRSATGEDPQQDTQASIHRTLREDLYLVLVGFDPNTQEAMIKAVVNPLIQFLWIGGLFLILGTAVVMWKGATRKQVQLAAGTRRRLQEEKAKALTAIRDLDFDYETAKLSAEDYKTLRAKVERQAVEVLKKQEEFEARLRNAETEADRLVDEIAPLPRPPKAGKAVGEQRFCPQCGSACTAEDRFCGSCGKALKVFVTAILCAVLLFAAPISRAADRGEFRGRVILVSDKQPVPQPGLTVQLGVFKNGEEVAGARSKTDGKGAYRFTDLDRAPEFSYQVTALYEEVPFELPRVPFGVQKRFDLPDLEVYPATADPKDLTVNEIVLVEFSKADLLKISHSLFFTNHGSKVYNPAGAGGRPVDVSLLPGGFQLQFVGSSAGRADLIPDQNKLRFTSPVKPGEGHEVGLEFAYLLPFHTRSITFDLPFNVAREKTTVALLNRDLPVQGALLQRQTPRKQGNDTLFLHTSGSVAAGESVTFTMSGLSLPGDTGRTLVWIGLALTLISAIGLAFRREETRSDRDVVLGALRSLKSRHASGRLTLPAYRAERARLRERLVASLLPDDEEIPAA